MQTAIDDLLVVGAGFAGLSAAIAIAKLGKNVTLVERSTALADGAASMLGNRAPDVLYELDDSMTRSRRALPTWNHTVQLTAQIFGYGSRPYGAVSPCLTR